MRKIAIIVIIAGLLALPFAVALWWRNGLGELDELALGQGVQP